MHSKNICSTLLILLVLTTVEINSLFAQQITGIVTDNDDDALPGVNVYIESLARGTVTDSTGYYQIKDLPDGRYSLRFSLLGYGQKQKTVELKPDTHITLNTKLRKQVLGNNEITVTGTPYAVNPLKNPADVDVITGTAKQRQQETSLGASLEELGGISSISTGTQVGKPVIRGLSGQRVRVLQNGMPMDYQQFGVRHGPNIDPFSAERIEVVRGASSVQYGSDALGGAINIIPNHISDARDRDAFISGKVLTGYASNNSEKVGGLHLDGADGGWGWTATVVNRSAGNMHAPSVPTYQETDDPEAPKFSGELDHTDYRQLNGSIGIGYTFDGGKVTADYIRWGNEQNFLLPSGEGLGQWLSNDHLHLSGKLKLNENIELEPDLSYQRNVRQSNAPGQPRSSLPDAGTAHLDLLLENYNAHLDAVHGNIGILSGRAGLEFQRQHQLTRGEESLVPSAEMSNIAGFIFERAEMNQWIFNAGLRIDHRSQDVKPNEELKLPNTAAGETGDILDRTYTEFSGSLGAIYQFTASLSVAANIGRGFRAPDVFELHAEGVHGGVAAYQVGNPYLNPEHSLTTDLSLRWRSDKLNAKATIYRNKIDNYIMLMNTGAFHNGIPVLENQQTDAVLLGGNASIRARLAHWLEIEGVFETVHGENVDKNLSSVNELPLLPPTNLDIKLRIEQENLWKLDAPYLQVKMNHTFPKEAAGRYEPFWQFGNTPKFSEFGVASTDAYTLFNADAGFDVPVRGQTASFILRVENIFDTAYRNFLDTYKGYALSPGRNVTIRLTVPFSLLN